MRKNIPLYLVLSAFLISTLIGCLGGTVTETVTSIQTETQTTTTASIHEELSTSEIVNKVSPAVAHILGDYGAGTGVVVDSKGYILTNNHVVEDENNVKARLSDGEQVTAEVVYRDATLDIAILKCSGTGYPFIPLGSTEESNLGDDVVVIGYPLSALIGESPSISKGVISAFRTFEGTKYIQTDAPINPGNSGGPLINTYGEVIGIVSWGIAETEGMNFAVDVNSLKTYIEDILQQLTTGGILTKTITQTITVTAPSRTVTLTKTLTQTQTVTSTVTAMPTPTTTTPTGNIIFSFTGVGERNTPPFSVNTSPWIFRCSTNWSGSFGVDLYSESSGRLGEMVVGSVEAGKVYETYIYGQTGNNLYFRIAIAPTDGEWTLMVIEVS